MKIVFSEHALFEIEFRKIKKEDIEHLIDHPMQRITARKNRIIMQSKYYEYKENKDMLLRVVAIEMLDASENISEPLSFLYEIKGQKAVPKAIAWNL